MSDSVLQVRDVALVVAELSLRCVVVAFHTGPVDEDKQLLGEFAITRLLG